MLIKDKLEVDDIGIEERTKLVCDHIFLITCDESQGSNKIIECLDAIESLIETYRDKVVSTYLAEN